MLQESQISSKTEGNFSCIWPQTRMSNWLLNSIHWTAATVHTNIYVYMSWDVVWCLLVNEAAGNEQQLALCDHPLNRSSSVVWYENRWDFIPFLILVFPVPGLSLSYLWSICHKTERTKVWTDGSQTLMKIFFAELELLYVLVPFCICCWSPNKNALIIPLNPKYDLLSMRAMGRRRSIERWIGSFKTTQNHFCRTRFKIGFSSALSPAIWFPLTGCSH